jgi:hypothetical protein
MRRFVAVFCAGFALIASPAFADLKKVDDQAEFVRLVSGKTMSRPVVRIEVSSDGRISGKGAAWDVTGDWVWRDGYFCRSLFWGGDALGYNCQEVRIQNGRIRFTSDKGQGDSAEFRLK